MNADTEKMKYELKTASRTVLADLYTPVGAYMRLRDIYPMSALMECSDYHDRANCRSFIGVSPMASVSVSRGVCTMSFPDGARAERTVGGSYRIEHALREFIDSFCIEGDGSGLCGLYGYTSFDAVRYTEDIATGEPADSSDSMPELMYVLFKNIVAFDHFDNTMTVVTLGDQADIDQLLKRLNKDCAADYGFRATGPATSTLTDEQHKLNIRRGIAHCKRGDVFQIVLSRRFTQPYEGDDFKLYRALRSVNPSPYLFYFDFGGMRLFGSSPETHCRIEGGRAYIDPIAGTTRRSGNAETDSRLAAELQADPKENAEHVMLVDLARNDLSRNCHDVKVEFYKELQYYSHVIHLVSRVSGTLNRGADPIKVFVDTFPAGTLSGAPKVRAMQLISSYEPHARGAYGGCIGCIGLDGSLNQAITIRTFVSRNGLLSFQAGGGIVARSDEQRELEEVNNKLGALRRAVELAEVL